MAGYFLFTVDTPVFRQLTTAPAREQCNAFADFFVDELDAYLDDFNEPSNTEMWPRERDAFSALVRERFVLRDWYADLTFDNAEMWDNVLHSLDEEPGETIGIDFHCYDYESIYWDCAEEAASRGAAMMDVNRFGCMAFRYSGKTLGKPRYFPMYSLYMPDDVARLLEQLQRIKSDFVAMPGGEGSLHEQFIEGLLQPVQDAADRGRTLWVQTDS